MNMILLQALAKSQWVDEKRVLQWVPKIRCPSVARILQVVGLDVIPKLFDNLRT